MSELSPQTALEMVKEVAWNVGVSIPNDVSEDQISGRLLNMLNRSMQHSVMAYDWPVLTANISIQLNFDDEMEKSIGVPADFLKLVSRYIFISDGKSAGSAYRKFTHCSPEEALNSLYTASHRMYNKFFVRRQKIYLIPANMPSATPAGTLTCNFFYKSCLAAISGDDIERDTKKSLEINTDKSLLDAELLILGAIMFYKKFSGQPYELAAQGYNQRLKSLVDGQSLSNYNPDVTNEGHISDGAFN